MIEQEKQDAHVWTWWQHNNPMPGKKWKRFTCPRCGAKTVKQASQLCQPMQMPCGDYECPADEDAPTYYGWLHVPSDEMVERDGRYWDEVAISEGFTTRDQVNAREALT